MSISENRQDILSDIQNVSKAYDRNPSDIKLMAVSKVQQDERIEEALQIGQRLFGENRVQEAQERWAERKTIYPDLDLHLIGPLQTNKVKDAVELFTFIQTLDREKLAVALAKEIQRQEKTNYPLFIQVNTGEETQKAGITPKELEDFYYFSTREQKLNICGLMCIPPIDEPPALHFALLSKLSNKYSLQELSMGMSADYTKAIPLGCTILRVGTRFFGERI